MKCTLNHGGGFYKVIIALFVTLMFFLFKGIGHCILCNAVYFWESISAVVFKMFLWWNYFLVEC